MKTNKKAQEEMVGFVLVVILVAVILLIFIGIFIRSDRGPDNTANLEVTQFLDAMLGYTTNCAIRYEPDYSSVEQLIVDCNKGKLCTSGQMACDVLDETVEKILEASWRISPERPVTGYSFTPVYQPTSGHPTEFHQYNKSSNCSIFQRKEVEKPISSDFSVSFYLCENPAV